MIETALISVYDKTGLSELVKELSKSKIRIISTGNTYRAIKELGVDVTMVSDVTGFPEILDGRVKTLHPKIHGGILARRDDARHRDELRQYEIGPIDLVIVNLYPFVQTVANPDATHEDIVEMIDIGGPAMIRAAAKNYRHVLVVTNPARYEDVISRLRDGTPFDEDFREQLALEAFAHTAAYDAHVQKYFMERRQAFPENITLTFERGTPLRYGENPHQQAAFYREAGFSGISIAGARQIHGTQLSYNNIMDAAAALEMAQSYERPTAVGVKHANPCGLASGNSLAEAFARVVAADPVSIFGGIVACNRPVDEKTAKAMSEIFLEVIVAPSFDGEAIEILAQKKNLRLLEVGPFEQPTPYLDLRRVPGGLLVQDADITRPVDTSSWRVVTQRQPSKEEWLDLAFGWKAVKFVKSNAIVVAKNESVIGVGAGQMNRVQSAKIALLQAGENAQGAIIASDAFFPFPDVVEAAREAKIAAIVQPGGSIRDQESIDAANRAGIAMVFTGQRHFRH